MIDGMAMAQCILDASCWYAHDNMRMDIRMLASAKRMVQQWPCGWKSPCPPDLIAMAIRSDQINLRTITVSDHDKGL